MEYLYNASMDELFNAYGCFVLMNFISGAEAVAVYKATEKKSTVFSARERNMDYLMSANVDVGSLFSAGLSFGGGGGASTGDTVVHNFKETAFSVCTYGGSALGVQFSPAQDVNDCYIDMSDWCASLKDKKYHTIVGFQDDALVPLYEFIEEDNLRESFIRVMERGYAEDNYMREPYVAVNGIARMESDGYTKYHVTVSLATRYGESFTIGVSTIKSAEKEAYTDFIKAYNFVDNGSNYVTEDLSNLVLTNPLTNEKLDLSNAKLVYGNQETRTNSVLADRVLLYLDKNDTSTYIILFAYNDEGNYKLYVPKFANYALLNIKDKVVLHNVRQAFFKYKNVKACLEQIETIFVLKKPNLQYPLLTLGQVLKNDPYYMSDSLINIGFFSFADGSQSFRQKFDISDMTISFYLKIKADLSEEKTNYLVQELKNFDFTKSVLNNYELKYNNLKNYLYIEL